MQYHQLGSSDMYISRIGFGCMSLQKFAEKNEQLIHAAVEKGINFFDTADIYDSGYNEELVGRSLKPYREKVYIATKVGNRIRKDGSGLDWDPSAKHIKAAVEGSLMRLQTDRIDLYQLHGGTIDDPIDETIDALEQLKNQGKIRHYGISSIRPNVIREWVKRSNIVSVMMQYSLLDRRPEEECLPMLKQHNIGVLARGSLAQGLLVNKPEKDYQGRAAAEVKTARDVLAGYVTTTIPSAQLAVRFVLRNDAVTAAIAGIRTMEQLEEAAGSLDGEIMSVRQYDELCSTTTPNHYKEHR